MLVLDHRGVVQILWKVLRRSRGDYLCGDRFTLCLFYASMFTRWDMNEATRNYLDFFLASYHLDFCLSRSLVLAREGAFGVGLACICCFRRIIFCLS